VQKVQAVQKGTKISPQERTQDLRVVQSSEAAVHLLHVLYIFHRACVGCGVHVKYC